MKKLILILFFFVYTANIATAQTVTTHSDNREWYSDGVLKTKIQSFYDDNKAGEFVFLRL